MVEVLMSVLLAGRIPIIISNNPWIMAIGIIVVIIAIAVNASSKQGERGSRPISREQVARAVSEVNDLLAEDRYRKAVELAGEASAQGVGDPLEPAVAYLETQGVATSTAHENMVKIAVVLEAAGRARAS